MVNQGLCKISLDKFHCVFLCTHEKGIDESVFKYVLKYVFGEVRALARAIAIAVLSLHVGGCEVKQCF